MGAGGWFICGVIYSMLKQTNTEITKNGSGHNLGFMYDSHNYDALTSDYPDEFWYYSEEEFNSNNDISEGIEWFKNNLKFKNQKIQKIYFLWNIFELKKKNIFKTACRQGRLERCKRREFECVCFMGANYIYHRKFSQIF